jgi:hypothetical protein
MSEPASLLAQLRGLGISVRISSDNLALRPFSAVPEDLKASLKAAKPELLALLRLEETADVVGTAKLTQVGKMNLTHSVRWFLRDGGADVEAGGTDGVVGFGSCPRAWCRSIAPRRAGPRCQAAIGR